MDEGVTKKGEDGGECDEILVVVKDRQGDLEVSKGERGRGGDGIGRSEEGEEVGGVESDVGDDEDFEVSVGDDGFAAAVLSLLLPRQSDLEVLRVERVRSAVVADPQRPSKWVDKEGLIIELTRVAGTRRWYLQVRDFDFS